MNRITAYLTDWPDNPFRDVIPDFEKQAKKDSDIAFVERRIAAYLEHRSPLLRESAVEAIDVLEALGFNPGLVANMRARVGPHLRLEP